MGLGKQAKTVTKAQVDAALNYLSSSRYPLRNRVILLLSVKAGLRAKEIASLTWDMVTTSDGELGNAIHLTNEASKGRGGGRVIPLNRELRTALLDLRQSPSRGRPAAFVITTDGLPGPPPKRSSTCSPAGMPTSASPAAPATAGDGPSSPTPPERSRRSAGRCGTSKCSPATRTSPRPSATSSRTPRRSGRSWSWYERDSNTQRETNPSVAGAARRRPTGRC